MLFCAPTHRECPNSLPRNQSQRIGTGRRRGLITSASTMRASRGTLDNLLRSVAAACRMYHRGNLDTHISSNEESRNREQANDPFPTGASFEQFLHSRVPPPDDGRHNHARELAASSHAPETQTGSWRAVSIRRALNPPMWWEQFPYHFTVTTRNCAL